MVRSPFEWFKTWRHGRGFGVHSPLAFSLLGEVLRTPDGVAYYDEEAISRIFPRGRQRRIARTVYRLAAYVNPASVAVLAHGARQALWSRLLHSAIPSARVTAKVHPDSRLVIVDDMSRYTPAPPPEADDTKGVYTIFTCLDGNDARSEFDSRISAGEFQGLVIDSRRDMALGVERRGLSTQTIAARF